MAGLDEHPDRDGDARAGGVPRLGAVRGRYARRVTADHVRERVSVRHLVDDPARGPVPTDVVGRLLAIDDDALVLVDRASILHVISTDSVLASRVVPSHPRLPAEPDVGTRRTPLVRHAARALVLDDADRVLLVAHQPGGAAGSDPPGSTRVWTAPGGGLDVGEEHADAVRREVREELGIDVAVGPWVWSRRVTFSFRGVWLDQTERWYLVRVPALDPARAPLTDVAVETARWWTLDELASTAERLAPRDFARHLAELLEHGAPEHPADVGI